MANRNKRPRPSHKSAEQEKTRVKKIVILIVCGALLWIFFAPGLGIVSYMSKKSELKRVQDQTIALQKANMELQAEIDRLLTDPDYLEQLAREKYNLLKPNEKVYDFTRKSKHSKKDEKE